MEMLIRLCFIFSRFTEYATDEKGLNLIQSQSDPCVFYKRDDDGFTTAIVVVYVDDCLITGEPDAVAQIKTDLKREFGVVEDGQLRKLLGVRYRWETDDVGPVVILDMQDKSYEIIKAYEDVKGEVKKTFKTPGKPHSVLNANKEEVVMHGKYRSILGKIMFYVTKIAPECCFACGQLAQHMHNPGEEHWIAMERFVGYLKQKETHELVIRKPTELRVYSYGDASYADCNDSRRSSSGDFHTMGGALVSWRSQKLKFVCLSTTEAEYVTLTEMSKEQRFLQMLLSEIAYCELPGVMYGDNEASIYLTKNKHVSARTKHIDIRHHYVREHIWNERGIIVSERSENNFADVLTKNVSIVLFEKLGKAILNGFVDWMEKFKFEKVQRENV